MTEKHSIKNIVKEHYIEIARGERQSCCGGGGCNSAEDIALDIGYSPAEIGLVPDANLGLGCGNPTAIAEIKAGDVVLDLGSGAGFDCFLAAQRVGPSGKVIGVDMAEPMVERARANAAKYQYENVEFRVGDIEELPVDSASVDKVISNCVINLAPDKLKVFREAARVLKPKGKMYVSDIVLTRELTAEQRADELLIAGCVGGAVMKDQYLNLIKSAGFTIHVLSEDPAESKSQYIGLPVQSLKVEATKI